MTLNTDAVTTEPVEEVGAVELHDIHCAKQASQPLPKQVRRQGGNTPQGKLWMQAARRAGLQTSVAPRAKSTSQREGLVENGGAGSAAELPDNPQSQVPSAAAVDRPCRRQASVLEYRCQPDGMRKRLRGKTPPPYSVAPVTLMLRGLNIQWPFSQLLLQGAKVDEVRAYELGHRGIAKAGEEHWIVETRGPRADATTNALTEPRLDSVVCVCFGSFVCCALR